jgi:superoxide dismutase
MKTRWRAVLSEVRQIKAGIMREYGSLEAWHKHLDEERPKLEKQGWKFITGTELRNRNSKLTVQDL